MIELKTKQVFDQSLGSVEKEQESADSSSSPELNAQLQFESAETFIPTTVEDNENESLIESEDQLERVIRPSKTRSWIATTLVSAFSGLIAWQAIDTVIVAIQTADWLTLGWASFIAAIASLGLGAIGKELWKLRKLKAHFSIQEQSETLLASDSVGKGKSFCQSLAKEGGIATESPAYDKWINSINPAHSDAEVLDMYDAMVVAQQDKQATKLVSQLSGEAALLVAISPLAVADMLLVAWRNFKMIDKLADIYGVELGYWSRVKLFKLVLINMAAAGASELAVDASMDLLSMDLAGKVSARAGQGIGVGILTARLGIKAMSLLRPIPWKKDRAVRLSTIRKQIVNKVQTVGIK